MHRILQTIIDRLHESTDVQALRAGTPSAREAPLRMAQPTNRRTSRGHWLALQSRAMDRASGW